MCSNLSCYQLSSGMCSNLSCYQLKADYYIHKMLYMNLYCNHKTKFLIHKMRKELKHNTKETIKLQRKREKKEGTERNYKNSQKTINKMTISIYQ